MIIRSSVRIINNLNIYFHAPIIKMRHNFKMIDADKRSFLKYVLPVHDMISSTHAFNQSMLIKYYFPPLFHRSAKSV